MQTLLARISHGRRNGVTEVEGAINAYLSTWNAGPQALHLGQDLEQILGRTRRAKERNGARG
jgi:hypothetical protein